MSASALAAEDRVELLDLVQRYAVLVDDRDPAGVAALFVEDGVIVSPDPPRSLDPVVEHAGRAAIEQAMAAVASLEASVHAVAGAVFDAGDVTDATGRVTCFAHHLVRHGEELRDVVWAVRYRDAYRRAPDGWRFVRRAATVTFLESRPVRAVRPGAAFG